jgi:phosphoserine phosphatase RsbU/P
VSAADPALLIVDDNEDNRYTLSRRLTRYGYTRLTTASNGREALQLLQTQPFDLVLLDIMMPEMNGYEVLERLKASAELRQLPVIMISAVDEMDSAIRCIELGAEDYLGKPFNPTLLRARIGASIEKKRLRDELRASLRRLQQELDAARALQMGMLPLVFPACSPDRPVEIHALMEPAREVGGDLYDCFYAGENSFCFLVGDVSGKGAPAAMFMARTRSLVRMAVQAWQEPRGEALSPASLAQIVNRELCQNNAERMFVTLLLGFLNTRTGDLAYVNAGHPTPYMLRASGPVEPCKGRPERPLGVRADTVYHNRVAALCTGDAVFVSTDGVIEAISESGELYTEERLYTELCALRDAPPETIVRLVKERVDAFSGTAPKTDDVTALALRWHGAML